MEEIRSILQSYFWGFPKNSFHVRKFEEKFGETLPDAPAPAKIFIPARLPDLQGFFCLSQWEISFFFLSQCSLPSF